MSDLSRGEEILLIIDDFAKDLLRQAGIEGVLDSEHYNDEVRSGIHAKSEKGSLIFQLGEGPYERAMEFTYYPNGTHNLGDRASEHGRCMSVAYSAIVAVSGEDSVFLRRYDIIKRVGEGLTFPLQIFRPTQDSKQRAGILATFDLDDVPQNLAENISRADRAIVKYIGELSKT